MGPSTAEVVLWNDLGATGLPYDRWVHELLRSVWDEPRPPHPPPRGWRDWALMAAIVVLAVLEGALRSGPWPVVPVLVAVGLAPMMLWRRTRPLLMVAIAFGVSALAPLLTGGVLPDLYALGFVLILPYALFRWGSGREAVIGSVVMIVKVGLSAVLGQITVGDALAGFVVLSTAVAAGAALRYRARARMRELDQVKLLERERLARDLHDTVAHHVSAMAIRAQAGLATMAAHPDAAADALRVIEAEASRTLAEMRTMVRTLRHTERADLAPSPRIADLGQLAGRDDAGPVVDVRIVGDVDGVATPVGTAIYRLAQESVTNARRHARHATRIEVRVVADEAAVHLHVSDDGDTGAGHPSPGFGLIGMMERADLLGGVCRAGPGPDRGWTVTAVLPRAGVAA